MKHKTVYKSILSILLFSLPLSLGAQDKLVLGSGVHHPTNPVIIPILTEAYAQLGIEIEVRELPPKRATAETETGVIDGELFRGNIDPQVLPNHLRVPVVLAYGKTTAFTLDENIVINGWESLESYTLGSQIGFIKAEQSPVADRIYFVKSAEQLFLKLISGRCDIVILPFDTGAYTLNSLKREGSHGQEELNQIQALEPPLEQGPLYHYLNKGHQDLIPQITAVLKEMEASGRIEEIRTEKEREVFGLP
ncbi:MAG: transporter substrate-binding domain-containing protein [Spirochaetales bacterium]|nr:transporter substrate-binding domain-containing protein [Spirochaetales bacterium]